MNESDIYTQGEIFMQTQQSRFKMLTVVPLLLAIFVLAACSAAPAEPATGSAEVTEGADAESAADGPTSGGTLRVAFVTTKTDIDVQSANTGSLNEIAPLFL